MFEPKLMFWLGLIVMTCSVPGWIGVTIQTQWALLSIILPLSLYRRHPVGLGELAGVGLLAYASLSLLWVPSVFDGLYGLWTLGICGLAFWYGTTSPDLRPLWKGLALGLSVSSGVCIAQWLGYSPVLVAVGDAGLLYNPDVLGAACALVIVALVGHRLWWWIPGMLPALILSHSVGAAAVLVFGLAPRRYVPWLIVGVCLFLTAYLRWNIRPSDMQRLTIWGDAWSHLTWLGYGIGSYMDIIIRVPPNPFANNPGLFHPEFLHNDFLQFWFELGIGSLFAYALYALPLMVHSNERSVFIGFFVLSTFFFPIHCAPLAFIGSVTAGHALGHWYWARGPLLHSGHGLIPWSAIFEPSDDRSRGEAVPAEF